MKGLALQMFGLLPNRNLRRLSGYFLAELGKKTYVQPTDNRGRLQWLSTGQPMHFDMFQVILNILHENTEVHGLSSRSKVLLDELRLEFDWVESEKTFLIHENAGNSIWWTFAGKLFNASMAESLAGEADKVPTDNLGISFIQTYNAADLRKKIQAVLSGPKEKVMIPIDEDFIQELKFSGCLSQQNIDWKLSERYKVDSVFDQISAMPVSVMKFS